MDKIKVSSRVLCHPPLQEHNEREHDTEKAPLKGRACHEFYTVTLRDRFPGQEEQLGPGFNQEGANRGSEWVGRERPFK